MRVVAKREQVISNDPKPMDRVTWQRVRGLVELEAVHRDWGCALYAMHRLGRIDNDQRDAGDRYTILIRDWRKLWRDPMSNFVVDDDAAKLVQFGLGHVAAAGEPSSEFETKRAERIGRRYKEARAIAGKVNPVLEDLLIDEVWPVGERGHLEIANALVRLSYFFNTGTKQVRRGR